ncbi:MFS transporter [Thermobifida cellulosilytica]|uniref:DSBA oxidoreductase n=1 Tax=Thermobifida cellulosilytica TB100 TaxID=665004 RepID=A0A147KM69_THECS|nr:MFS transporter [Thermobifida cellulosilytica]KUP98353.1 DSBA oxidoreductase [Thermobifida cellulosilytica TB100]
MPSSPPRARWLALAALCTGTLMIVLDGSVVTVALPQIQRDLAFSPADLTWTVNAYLIAFGGLLLFAGRLGDLLGHGRVFVAGLLLFTAASLLCGLATGQAVLVAARFLQGVGAAAVSAVGLGMTATLFPEPGERAKAFGVFGFVGAAGASIGQVLGGLLTEAFGWPWIFFVNLPFGVAVGLLSLRVLDLGRGPGLRAGADALGAVLATGGLMLGIATIVATDPHGWASVRTVGGGLLAVALLAAFAVRQSRAAAPLLPPRVFRTRAVPVANLAQLLTLSAMFGVQILAALYLQDVLGYGALATGAAMLPAAVAIGAASLFLAPRLIARLGERTVLLTGLGLLVAAFVLFTRLTPHAGYVTHVLPTMLLLGGFGLVLPSLTALGMSGASPEDAGVVSGLFNTGRQVGSALGVAVLSTLAAARADALLAAGQSTAQALTGGYTLAFGTAAGLVAAAFVLVAALLRRPRRTAAAAAPVGTSRPAA